MKDGPSGRSENGAARAAHNSRSGAFWLCPVRLVPVAIVALILLPLAAGAESPSANGAGLGLPLGTAPISNEELGSTVAHGPQRPSPLSQQRLIPRVKLWDELAATYPAAPQGSQAGTNSVVVTVRTIR